MKELIIINIELKDSNSLKEFFHKLHYKIEDIVFSIITKIPEKFIPTVLMDWLDQYTTKRMNELDQQL